MCATARVAAAQRAHSIVLCTPTASYARLRSFHAAAASPRASTGASLAPRGRAAAQCNAGPALYGESWEPAKFLEEGKGEEEEDVAAYGRMQAGGGALLVIKGLEEPLQANQVKGDAEAWQFIIDYPLMDTKTRNIKLEPDKDSTALLMAKMLEVAEHYQMQVLLHEFEAFRTSWTRYTHNSFRNDKPTPETPAWWIDLATKHPYDSHKLAGPAICALLRKSTYRAYGDDVALDSFWQYARLVHLKYGKKQEGELWGLVCQLLEGCDA